jgi:hypothetical protein
MNIHPRNPQISEPSQRFNIALVANRWPSPSFWRLDCKEKNQISHLHVILEFRRFHCFALFLSYALINEQSHPHHIRQPQKTVVSKMCFVPILNHVLWSGVFHIVFINHPSRIIPLINNYNQYMNRSNPNLPLNHHYLKPL